ncbi:hypothetical protein ES703_69328 [subsurface metagenome]
MPEPSMGEGVASPHKAAARGGQAAARGCLLKPCPLPEPAIRCPVGCLPLLKERQAVKPCRSYRGKG